VRFTLTALLALFVAAPEIAFAAARNPQMEKARQLIEDAEFDQALKVLNDVLSQSDLTDAVLVSGYELQGTAYLYLGKETLARQAFEKLLQAEPDHELPKGTSSKIRSLFEQLRAGRKGFKPVKLTFDKVSSAKAGKPLELKAQVADLPEGAKVRLYYRRSGSESYSSTSFSASGGGDFVALVPAFELPIESSEYALEYYVEVGDPTGRRVAGVGDALSPMLLRVSAAKEGGGGAEPAVEQSEAWYQKWWVWTIAGAVAVGAGVGIAVPLLANKQANLPITVRIQQ
jgi:tetratricopeptide (TPR) repeat protein